MASLVAPSTQLFSDPEAKTKKPFEQSPATLASEEVGSEAPNAVNGKMLGLHSRTTYVVMF